MLLKDLKTSCFFFKEQCKKHVLTETPENYMVLSGLPDSCLHTFPLQLMVGGSKNKHKIIKAHFSSTLALLSKRNC